MGRLALDPRSAPVWWSLLMLACAHPPPSASAPSAAPLPPLCQRDLTGWRPEGPSHGFLQLSAEQIGVMVAPSMVEAQRRACGCLAQRRGEEAAYTLDVTATPARGQATATLRPVGDGALAACVGVIETTFTGWPLGCSDVIDGTPRSPSDCGASIRLPVVLDLSLSPP